MIEDGVGVSLQAGGLVIGMFGIRPARLVGVDVALGDVRETYAFMFPAMCFGFPPLGKWVQPLMDERMGVTGLLAGFCKCYGGPGAKAISCFLPRR